jgi:nitrate/nitrite transport system permease protein
MNTKLREVLLNAVVLPLVGVGLFLAVWQVASVLTYNPDKQRSTLPSPAETVKQSSKYLAAPFSHNEAEGFDGLGLLTLQSLSLVARGYLVALVLGVPLGFMLGSSKIFTTTFDPIFQVLRPVSPLAWFPLAGLIMVALKRTYPTLDATTWQCVVTIAICALWPTALNTAVGVRAIPQDYLNVAKVLKLSPAQRFIKILIPASLPYMFTGFRLSLGIAWLVIVAAEMLSGKTGIGFFVFDSYNAENYGAMLMSILVIGVVGFVLDRVMSLAERNVDTLLNLPSAVLRKVRSVRAARPVAARPAAGEGRSVAHAVS